MTETEVSALYAEITRSLIRNKLEITTMESATGGFIASLLTDTEGASAILKGAFVSYSNEAKRMFGVDADIIEKFSVYSPETAIKMADVCRERFRADIGVGVTGTFGNTDPANAEFSKPGEIFYAISTRAGAKVFSSLIGFRPSRHSYKLAAAELVGIKLIETIEIAINGDIL